MSDLISRCELFNRLAPVQTLGEAYGVIQGMDTVDAVPVVRCRDCKHHDGIRCFRWNSTIITGFDDFCSNGEQNDGKGNGNETD